MKPSLVIIDNMRFWIGTHPPKQSMIQEGDFWIDNIEQLEEWSHRYKPKKDESKPVDSYRTRG